MHTDELPLQEARVLVCGCGSLRTEQVIEQQAELAVNMHVFALGYHSRIRENTRGVDDRPTSS